MLLEHFGGRLLSVQPRRLAVRAVAERVAEQMNVTLGSKVGYHIGNDNKSCGETTLLFVTARHIHSKSTRLQALQSAL